MQTHMGEDKSTYSLQMRGQMGPEDSKHTWGGQKHAPTRHEETKGGLRTTNTDGRGQKHALAEEETKRGLRTGQQIQMGENKTTHLLHMRRQKGV